MTKSFRKQERLPSGSLSIVVTVWAFQGSTAPLTRNGFPLLLEGTISLNMLATASDNETLVTSFLLVNDNLNVRLIR